MNVLASALSEAMTSSPNALNVLDADSGEWQRIVERMGGAITLASEPGIGSTFTFTLPL